MLISGLLLTSMMVTPGAESAAPAAGPLPPLFGRPRAVPAPLDEAAVRARREAFERYKDERGLVQRGDIVAPPWYFDDEPDPGMPRSSDWSLPPHRATIFLNFFGGEMRNGTNSALMESTCIQGNVNYPAYIGNNDTALAIIQVFQNAMEPYGVRVAYEEAPPPELPYQMVMMGGQPGVIGLPNGTLGVSCSSDCGDMWWRDTTFAFTEASSQTSVLGNTALQEAAHAFGLAHIDGSEHIMYPFATPGAKIWATSCTNYNDATGGINCKPTHDIFCGGGSQNSDAELMAYFGANSPDTEAPVVTITNPAEDVVELESGGAFTVDAEISDNFEGAGWKLMILDEDGQEVQSLPAFTFEKSWSLSGFPDGVWTVRVQATDHDRNVGFDEITVYSGMMAPGTTSGTGTSGGTASGGEMTTSVGGTGTPNPPDDCACRTGGAGGLPSAAWTLLLLPLVGAGRRRAR